MSNDDHEPVTVRKSMTTDQLRDLAVQRLRKQSDFRIHLMVYLAVNGLLILVWAWTGVGFFWPVFPLVAWGIGLGANAWDAFGRKPITEEQIEREVRRLER